MLEVLMKLQLNCFLLRWAAEGLSFLTLDAEVKEKLVEDEPAMRLLSPGYLSVKLNSYFAEP